MALTHLDIVTTALTLLRQYGLADLSMRRIAKELGVQPGALYWHVKNKQELLVALAHALTAMKHDDGTHPPAPSSASAGPQIMETAARLRTQLAGIPDGAEVVQLAYALDPDSVEPLVELRRTLEGADPQRAASVTDAVAFLVFGELIATQAREMAGASPVAGTDTTAVLELLADQFSPTPRQI